MILSSICRPSLVLELLLLTFFVLEWAVYACAWVELAQHRIVPPFTASNLTISTITARALRWVFEGTSVALCAVRIEGTVLLVLELSFLSRRWMLRYAFAILTGGAIRACIVHIDAGIRWGGGRLVDERAVRSRAGKIEVTPLCRRVCCGGREF